MRKAHLFIIFFTLILAACDGYNDDYIPYDIEGYDVYVYVGEKEFYAGRVETNYFNSEDNLSEAQSLARAYATNKGFSEWGYIICTVTSDSDCVTTVR